MNARPSSRELWQAVPHVPEATHSSAYDETEGGKRRKSALRLGRPLRYGWALGPLVLITLWTAGSASGLIDARSLPAPWTVVTTGVGLVKDGRLQDNLGVSLERLLEGFFFGVLAGIAVALVSGLNRIGEYLIDSTVQIKRSLPTVALIPLLMLYLGIGETMKITVVALSVAIPVYINVHSHLRAIDNRYVELAETLRLRYSAFVRHIVLPGALPGLFLGLRLGVTSALLALVVVEQINATSGIGYIITLAGSYGQIDIVLVGLVVYGCLGLASDAIVRLIQKKALSWQRTFES